MTLLGSLVMLVTAAALGQTPQTPAQLPNINHVVYTNKSELFLEYRPLIVGQAVRMTAHLTKVGDSFKAYTEGTVKLELKSADGAVILDGNSPEPERAGVFRINVTPTKAGKGRAEISVVTKDVSDRFVIDDLHVYPDQSTASAQMPRPDMTGTISYSKENQWDNPSYATMAVAKGPNSVPKMAVVEDNGASYVFVLRTAERFEKRKITVGRANGADIQITDGLRDSERIVSKGADKIPLK